MINTNDLIGLRRAWGAAPGDNSGMIDCCLMATEVHRRLGYYDYTQDIMQYFEQYTDETFPPSIIPRWLLKNAQRLKAPEDHAVALMRGNGMGALGTVLDDKRMIYISGGSGVVVGPIIFGATHFFRLNK
jgi:hypothetical protein